MTDDKPIMNQVHEYKNLVADVLSEGMKMCDVLQANVLLEKFPPSWNEYRNHLKPKKKDLNFQKLISHMRTEEANHLKDKEISNSSISFEANLVESSPSRKDRLQPKGEGNKRLSKETMDQQKPSHKPPSQPRPQINLTEQEEVIAAVVVEANLMENKIAWILDTGASKHFCSNKELFQDFQEARDGECVFMGNSTTAGVLGKGKIFLKLTSGKTLALIDVLYVHSLRRNLISGSLLDKAGTPMIPSTTELRRSKRQKTETSFGPDFLTIFLAEDIDRIDDHLVSAFFIDEDPKTYIEAVTSVDSSFLKEVIKNELDTILENHTWDLADLPRVINDTKRFLSSQFGMKDLGEADVILEGFCDANWVTDNDEVSSTSGYVFTLGGGAISWKSVKQTCIARSTMESEFIALELAGQEAEWLRNLVGDMPMWGSSIPVSIHCDSQAAIGIAKNYAYNGKRRHIRIRHGTVKELLKNGKISLEYVRSERNLAMGLNP
ncbi:Retrovirus-related Pol polyprotein from transposon TNT 1-94 [Sesamum angolense]|uniref:Retrovirus-related Pol polyprotein from transposon TNT 1-94 n=1 Tax=Sesamum angolense TaxID=2727404 RepID=A0AAE2C265_9LAMI|nr:Retrovirus-related Pol polyprotein from transposon TNT 1-94 [Sesamum angolense]